MTNVFWLKMQLQAAGRHCYQQGRKTSPPAAAALLMHNNIYRFPWFFLGNLAQNLGIFFAFVQKIILFFAIVFSGKQDFFLLLPPCWCTTQLVLPSSDKCHAVQKGEMPRHRIFQVACVANAEKGDDTGGGFGPRQEFVLSPHPNLQI